MSDRETIAAIATPPGTGAVALVRVSGPRAVEIASHACTRPLGTPRSARLRTIRDGEGRVLDQALVTFFPAPFSYTGEDVVEISTHGGSHLTRRVLERLLECGALPAQPGEFTRRAFVNGRMDLTQAEAVMDLISARSDLALRAAHEQLEGALGRRIEELRHKLVSLIAQVEAWIDFPDEDIDVDSAATLEASMAEILGKIGDLLATAEQGRILREGIRTVISGLPNAGKSSLLNELLGIDRAIVSDIAGTTRDTIEESAHIDGILLRLIDTAGLHEAADALEEAGVRRARAEAARADLRLLVADATLAPDMALPGGLPPAPRELLILNKTDLGEHPGWTGFEAVRLSCTRHTGFDELRRHIHRLVTAGQDHWGEHPVAVNARHRSCLQRAATAMAEAQTGMAAATDAEIVALDLREALDAVGEIIGRVDNEQILGEIFSRFCIGK